MHNLFSGWKSVEECDRHGTLYHILQEGFWRIPPPEKRRFFPPKKNMKTYPTFQHLFGKDILHLPRQQKGTRFWSVGGGEVVDFFMVHPGRWSFIHVWRQLLLYVHGYITLFLGKSICPTTPPKARPTVRFYKKNKEIWGPKKWGGYEHEVISPYWPPPIGHPLVVESEVRAAESQISSGSKSWRSICSQSWDLK